MIMTYMYTTEKKELHHVWSMLNLKQKLFPYIFHPPESPPPLYPTSTTHHGASVETEGESSARYITIKGSLVHADGEKR